MGKKRLFLAALSSFLAALFASAGFCAAAGRIVNTHSYRAGDEFTISSETGGQWNTAGFRLSSGMSYSGSPFWIKVRVGNDFTTTVSFPLEISEYETTLEIKGLESYGSATVSYVLPMGEMTNLTRGVWETGGGFVLRAASNAVSPLNELVSYGIYTQHIAATPRPRQISFNANGGSGSMAGQTLTSGTPLTLTANSFTRASGEFLGWNTEADGSGTAYEDEATLNYADVNGDLTLYAQWRVTSFLDTGEHFDLKIKSLANPSLLDHLDDSAIWSDWNSVNGGSITSVQYVKSLPSGVDTSNYVNLAVNGAIPVYAYLDGTDIYIVSEANHLMANGDSSRMFYGFSGLSSVTSLNSFLAVLDTSNVTDMTEMFYDLNFLGADSSEYRKTFTLPESFDTSNVLYMTRMFYGFGRLTRNDGGFSVSFKLPESFDTSNVVDMTRMFYWFYAYNFELPTSFVANNGVDMTEMFELGWTDFDFIAHDQTLLGKWSYSGREGPAVILP